jgi:hypothetical protein
VPRSDRLSIISVLMNAHREFAPGHIVLGRRGHVLFSSDRFLTTAGGRAPAAGLVADALVRFATESPLRLAKLVGARIRGAVFGADAIRVVAMSDAAARALTGLTGPLLHADSVPIDRDELVVALMNGDGHEPCSFHGRYRASAGGWMRADAASYIPVPWSF